MNKHQSNCAVNRDQFLYRLTQTFGDIERINKMSFLDLLIMLLLHMFSFYLNYYMKRFKTVPPYFMAIYLFLQLMRIMYIKVK